jgi:hypothetical protein
MSPKTTFSRKRPQGNKPEKAVYRRGSQRKQEVTKSYPLTKRVTTILALFICFSSVFLCVLCGKNRF